MIERLRRRFVAVAMAAATVVIVLVGLAISGAGLYGVCARADHVLSVIVANGGTIPRGTAGLDPETPFSARYLVVEVGPDGTAVGTDLSHVATVTAADVVAFARRASAASPGFSWYDGYRCLVTEDGQRRTAVFLDCRGGLASLETTALATVAVGAAADLLVYLFVRLFSARAIDPLVQAAQRQQRFVTDASHELKTPVTVIVTSLRVLEMEVGENRWIEKASRQAHSLARLVDDLVVLSRLEDEGAAVRERVDLSSLVAGVADDLADFASVEGHGLRAEVEPGVSVEADPRAVGTLLSVLLDNAVKYALPGGEVTLSLARVRRGAELRVSNPAEPLDPEALGRVFDRFYRPDEARSRETGGFGIGLAQAAGIVGAHGGTVRATQGPGADGANAFTVTVWLPAKGARA